MADLLRYGLGCHRLPQQSKINLVALYPATGASNIGVLPQVFYEGRAETGIRLLT
jgi:hypothetical protein